MNTTKLLTSKDAFSAMYRFLEVYWERGKAEEIAMLLGSMTLQEDDIPADPTLWEDWEKCVDEIINARSKPPIL